MNRPRSSGETHRTMEALRSKIDSLQSAELREEKPGASEQIDREAELERTEINVAELTDHVRVLEQQLAERTNAAEGAELRAERAETRVVERTEGSEVQAMSEEEAAELRAAVEAHKEVLAKTRRELKEWERPLDEEERSGEAEKEALLQRAQLDRYRLLEEERHKWEVQESHLFTQLATRRRSFGQSR